MPNPALGSAERAKAWTAALDADRLPDFVEERFKEHRSGRLPWTSTMTPAELLTAKTHGLVPIAMVSGTCWYHYGYSWTEGHAAGWRTALARLKAEAVAAGANAVVDVKLRTVEMRVENSMDYTMVGTAVRMEGLPPSPDPAVATTSTLEFVRLIEAGIVPVGLAVGARYEWITPPSLPFGFFGGVRNMLWTDMSDFWERLRRQAHADLRADAARQGNGVLTHTHFGQLLKVERENQPTRYLGRHIVMGTVVEVAANQGVPHGVAMVLDMEDASSLDGGKPHHIGNDAIKGAVEGAI